MIDNQRYQHELVDKAFNVIFPSEHKYENTDEEIFIRELFRGYYMYMLDTTYLHPDDKKWQKRMRKAYRYIFDAHLLAHQTVLFDKLHRRVKMVGVNVAMQEMVDGDS